MPATIDEIVTGNLLSINEGLGLAVGVLNPLAAQLDLSLSIGLSPLKSNISAALEAALGFNAALNIAFTDPFANIRAALEALIQLQASLSLALSLPPLALPEISLEIGFTAELIASLSLQLGGLDLAIDAALAIKIPAVRLAADLNAALSAGPAVLLAFDGISDPTNMQTIGNLIATKFSSPVGAFPDTIDPTDDIAGIMIITAAPSAYVGLEVIFPI
jgi:hypothetical protein